MAFSKPSCNKGEKKYAFKKKEYFQIRQKTATKDLTYFTSYTDSLWSNLGYPHNKAEKND